MGIYLVLITDWDASEYFVTGAFKDESNAKKHGDAFIKKSGAKLTYEIIDTVLRD